LHLYKNIDPDDADWVISEFWFLTPHWQRWPLEKILICSKLTFRILKLNLYSILLAYFPNF
jgi:hypothetical protein